MDPQAQDDALAQLILLTSDPRFLDRAASLIQKLEKLLRQKTLPLPAPPKPRPGQVLSAIRLVLLEHPDGLQTYEIRQLVAERLGRKLPRSTVKGALASRSEFIRLAKGRYKLADESYNE